MENTFSAGDVLFGVFYPRGYIVAVFDEADDVDKAVVELASHGIEGDDVTAWTGRSARRYIKNLRENLGVISQMAAKLPLSGDEKEAADLYLKLAEEGHEFITVRVADEDQVGTIRALLAEHNAHTMRYYGDWAVTDLRDATSG